MTSIDWRTYHSLTLGDDMPSVESVLVDRHDVEATGAGETAITVIAAAVGNAIFDATGAPHSPDAIHARAGEERTGLETDLSTLRGSARCRHGCQVPPGSTRFERTL